MNNHGREWENHFPHPYGGNYANLNYPAILKTGRAGEISEQLADLEIKLLDGKLAPM